MKDERVRRFDVSAGDAGVCPGCGSVRVRPFLPDPEGVDYRCRDCGRRWLVRVKEYGAEPLPQPGGGSAS